ncbi:MMPL family protein [Mycobacterium kansasii 732]|nr:MMPL family protein [Mycobacterium kansasii 732]
MVGGDRCATVIQEGVQYRCSTAQFDRCGDPRRAGGRRRRPSPRHPRRGCARPQGADSGDPDGHPARSVRAVAGRAGPPTLLAATILGALAALGLGGWASIHVFGFPALDNSTPLFAFLFLAALGVDYTIFLVTRAREEAAHHGARDGMIRAVSATGGVITSAGIVLAAVFCVLGVLPLIALTQIGIIVGLGILLDTFVVRTLVIPALFTLIGDRIWWPTFPNHADYQHGSAHSQPDGGFG